MHSIYMKYRVQNHNTKMAVCKWSRLKQSYFLSARVTVTTDIKHEWFLKPFQIKKKKEFRFLHENREVWVYSSD